jgi:hypothetical protein
MEQESRFATLASRLAVYGLEKRRDHLPDLRIEDDQTVELDARDDAFSRHHVSLRPRTLHDLKRWIGIPDDAVRVVQSVDSEGVVSETRLPLACAPHIAQPPILPDNPAIQNHLHRFLFGHSDEVDVQHMNLLEAYLHESPISISLFALQDIYVGKRSRLVISAKTQVLFARYITIETTGVLELKAPYARIDCAGIRRLPPWTLADVVSTKANVAKDARRASE